MLKVGSMQTTARMLEALSKTNERLIAMYSQLRRRAEVSSVTHEMDLRGYYFDFYVQAYLTSGKDLCWCLEIEWNDVKWIIRSAVVYQQEGMQETLIEFPERIAKCIDEVLMELEEATTALVTSSDSIDLSAPY